jgi:general L-amino acid transport system substrate-binding protein
VRKPAPEAAKSKFGQAAGLVGVAPNGHAEGLYLDVCRAIGAAILGPEARLEFHQYDSDKAFDAVRDDVDDVFFLSASEIVDQDLAGKVAPGPTVFNEQTAVMVAGASPYRGLSDLARQPLCYLMGDSAERHRNAWFREHGLDFIHQAYQEEVELYDTFNVQVCKGLAAEITTLAAVRLSAGEKDLHSRILGEPLAVFPIFATTGTRDGQWSAIVAWAIDSLLADGGPDAPSSTAGVDAFPIKAPELGLSEDRQKRVVSAAGDYADIYRRNLGDRSRQLPPGPIAPRREGGLFVQPYLE